jgi:Na+/H+-dicarboxylate symporter
MKFLKSLPARLLLAIAVGIIAGFFLPKDAMQVVVTLKYILG